MGVSNWQKKLLPFFIIAISALAICFVVFYFIHISDIERALENTPAFQASQGSPADETLTRWNDLKDLEKFSIANRYYNSRLIIRSRLLIISLSFLTGIVLCFAGAVFILGKFSENPTSIEGGREKINLKLVSSSPGIILAVLGVIIICVSMLSKIDLTMSDSPLYMPDPSPDMYIKKMDTSQHAVDTVKKKMMDDLINQHKQKN